MTRWGGRIGFVAGLLAWGERYMLAVPGNTFIRDLETARPASSGRGRPPTPPWQHVEVWSASLNEDAWKRIDVRDGL